MDGRGAATYAACEEVAASGLRCGMWTECGPNRVCVRTASGLPGVFDYTCEAPSFDPEDGCEAAAAHPCGADCADLGSMLLLTCDCPG